MSKDFITNEWRDFLDNLKHLETSIQKFHKGEVSEFKWMAIILFMTLQSAFVICLKKTDFHNVTRNETFNRKIGYTFKLRSNWDAGKVEVNHEKFIVEISTSAVERTDQFVAINKALPKKITKNEFAKIFSECWMLVNFHELYKRVKSEPRMRQYISSKPLPSNPKFDAAIQDLIQIRNGFIHFAPKSWSITRGHVKTIIIPCLEILYFLLSESGNIYPDDPRTATKTIDGLITTLKESV